MTFLEYLFLNREKVWNLFMKESYRSKEPPELLFKQNKWLRKMARCKLPEGDMAAAILRLKCLKGMTNEEIKKIKLWTSIIKVQSIEIRATNSEIEKHITRIENIKPDRKG